MSEIMHVKGLSGAGRVLLLCAACLLPAASPAAAARIYPSAGSASAAFLKIGVGGRAVGMAGAYTAVGGSPEALYWNPAGLAQLRGKNLAFTHNDYFAGLAQEYAVYTMPSSLFGLLPQGLRGGTVGFSLNYFHTGSDLERRSGSFESAGNISSPEGRFGAHDLALASGIGFRCDGPLTAGFAVKLIGQTIDDRSAGSAALDLGALYELELGGRAYTAGFALRNLGPGIKFVDRSYPLPLTAAAGLSRRLPGGTLLSLDISKPVDNYPAAAFGVETPLAGRLLLRGGYRLRQYGNESGGLSGLATGLGFRAGNFSFDYALAPFGDLGNTHRLSAAFRFSEPAAKKPAGLKELRQAQPGPASGRIPVNLESRNMALTRGGVTRLFKGKVSGAAALRGVAFAALTRGAVPSAMEIALEKPSGRSAETFPAGEPAAAWQLLSVPEGIGGEIRFEFVLPESGSAGAVYLYYLSRGQWRAVPAAAGACEEAVCAFTASAPLSTEYAVAVR